MSIPADLPPDAGPAEALVWLLSLPEQQRTEVINRANAFTLEFLAQAAGQPDDVRDRLFAEFGAAIRQARIELAPTRGRLAATPFVQALGLDGRMTAALRAAGGWHRGLWVCRHVLAGGPALTRFGAVICLEHPRQGARCYGCHREHADTHAPTPRALCAGGAQAAEADPVAFVGAADFRVREPSGRVRRIDAALWFDMVKLCPACTAHHVDPLTNPAPQDPDQNRPEQRCDPTW